MEHYTDVEEKMSKDHTRVKGDMLSMPKQDLVKFKSQLDELLANSSLPRDHGKGEWFQGSRDVLDFKHGFK